MAATPHLGLTLYRESNAPVYSDGAILDIPHPSLTNVLGGSSKASSPLHLRARDDVLEDTIFPELRTNEESDVDALQKEDPIGIDMWKFYRGQSRVPDAERMENMTWRMMAINLRKAQRKKKSARTAVRHVSAPGAESWLSPTTARQRTTTPHRQGPANPSELSSGDSSRLFPEGGVRNVESRDLSNYQFSFTSDYSQFPRNPSRFQSSFESNAMNGPRGHVQIPGEIKDETDVAGPHAPLDIGFYPNGSFDVKSAFTSNIQHAPFGNVTSWGPGWAAEAFGGRSLYDIPEVKKEETEREPLFDADGYLLPDGCIAQGAQASALHRPAPSQNSSQWQLFNGGHYVEPPGKRLRIRM